MAAALLSECGADRLAAPLCRIALRRQHAVAAACERPAVPTRTERADNESESGSDSDSDSGLSVRPDNPNERHRGRAEVLQCCVFRVLCCSDRRVVECGPIGGADVRYEAVDDLCVAVGHLPILQLHTVALGPPDSDSTVAQLQLATAAVDSHYETERGRARGRGGSRGRAMRGAPSGGRRTRGRRSSGDGRLTCGLRRLR